LLIRRLITARTPRLACTALMVGLAVSLLYPVAARSAWLSPFRLTTTPHASLTSSGNAKSVAVDPQGNIHVVWWEGFYGGWYEDLGIYHRVLDGTSWSQENILTHGWCWYPRGASVAVDGSGCVHIVWFEEENCGPSTLWSGSAILYMRSGGQVEGLGSAYDSLPNPSIAADVAGRVHVVWCDEGVDSSSVQYRGFDGSSWGPVESLSASSGRSRQASVAASSGGKIHVVWQEDRDGNWEIYYQWFDGSEWQAEERLTDTPYASRNPSICAGQGDTVYVAWSEGADGESRILCSVGCDGAWSTAEQVTVTPGAWDDPNVAASGGGVVHIVWSGASGGESGIFHSSREGPVWSDAWKLAGGSHDVGDASVAVDADGNAHIVWHDDREGNSEVFWTERYNGDLAQPVVTGLVPDRSISCGVLTGVVVSGLDFLAPDSVRLEMDGQAPIIADNVRVIASDSIVCDLSLASAHFGLWNVVIKNPDGQTGGLLSGFEVLPLPKPSVTSIEPDNGPSGLGFHIDGVSGSDFISPAAVWLMRAGERALKCANVSVGSPNSITCDVSLEGASPGLWNVVVENPDGGRDTLESGFTVEPGPWSRDTRLTQGMGESMTPPASSRCLATDAAGRVHVVWSGTSDGCVRVYYKVFDGQNWSTGVPVSSERARASGPSITVDGLGRVHTAWHEYRDGDSTEIYYRMLELAGWQPEERVTASPGNSKNPSIAVDQSCNVHLVWSDKRSGEWQIHYRKRGTEEWSAEEELTDSNGGRGNPSIAVGPDGNLHVAWYDHRENRFSTPQIYYRRFDGSAWEPDERVTYSSRPCWTPSIAVGQDGCVHIVWNGSCVWNWNDCDIHYVRYDGTAWGSEEIITSASNASTNPSVVTDDSLNVHVVWLDRRSGNREIYYKRWDRNGWGTDVRLTANEARRTGPSVAMDPSGGIQVVWSDSRDGSWEIYHKARSAQRPSSVSGLAPSIGRIVPNPCPGVCAIEVKFHTTGLNRLTVYDVRGRLVWSRDTVIHSPGSHWFAWDGKDVLGMPVASGVYFATVESGVRISSKKMVVLK